MLCVFWQETSFGDQNGGMPPGGIGSCKKDCFKDVKATGCDLLKKFKNYNDFVKNATACEKAQAAQDYMTCVGLAGYGPPKPKKGKPDNGNYFPGSPTRKKIDNCVQCLSDAGNSRNVSIAQDYPCNVFPCCASLVHSGEIPPDKTVTILKS